MSDVERLIEEAEEFGDPLPASITNALRDLSARVAKAEHEKAEAVAQRDEMRKRQHAQRVLLAVLAGENPLLAGGYDVVALAKLIEAERDEAVALLARLRGDTAFEARCDMAACGCSSSDLLCAVDDYLAAHAPAQEG